MLDTKTTLIFPNTELTPTIVRVKLGVRIMRVSSVLDVYRTHFGLQGLKLRVNTEFDV